MKSRGARRPGRKSSRQRGFTLIEILVALSIAGLAVSVMVVSVNAITDASLRSTSLELAGAMKFAYDRSIMMRRTERLAIDMDARKWWLEVNESPFALSRERVSGTRGEADTQKEDKEKKRRDEDEEDELGAEAGLGGGFAPEADDAGKVRSLPSDVYVSRIWTGHQEEPFHGGTAYVHFMKSGFAEPALIELVDCEVSAKTGECADGSQPSIVTLEVQPLTGRVRTFQERIDPPKPEVPDGREEGDE